MVERIVLKGHFNPHSCCGVSQQSRGTFFCVPTTILFAGSGGVNLEQASITTKCKAHRVFLINNRVLQKHRNNSCPKIVVLLEAEA